MAREEITQENLDIARVAFGAYQSYSEKPARVEVSVYKDGSCVELIYGQVNPCEFGDQCEGHTCYCNSPEAYRKCRYSSYYGEKDLDSKCEFFKPNPYWQDGEGDFYEQREKTLLYLQSKGLLDIEIYKVDYDALEHHKGKKSSFNKE